MKKKTPLDQWIDAKAHERTVTTRPDRNQFHPECIEARRNVDLALINLAVSYYANGVMLYDSVLVRKRFLENIETVLASRLEIPT